MAANDVANPASEWLDRIAHATIWNQTPAWLDRLAGFVVLVAIIVSTRRGSRDLASRHGRPALVRRIAGIVLIAFGIVLLGAGPMLLETGVLPMVAGGFVVWAGVYVLRI